MTWSVRLQRAALVGGTLLGFACGESSGPVRPKTLTAVTGDGQFWIVSAPLPAPLRVRVIGSDNQPLTGATVSWAVTAGSATVGAATSATDSLGIAAATVTLGAVAEPSAVQATVMGLPPVSFNVAACVVEAFTLGAPVSAALATTDCRANGFYTDVYSLDLTSGQQSISLAMGSTAFDAFLEVYHGAGPFIAGNNDSAVGTRNSVVHLIAAPGNYVIAPSSYDPDTTGAYSVSAVTWAPTLAGCAEVWVTRGVTFSDSVTATDCRDYSGTYYADRVYVFAMAGTVLKIAERSTAFDAELFLVDRGGSTVAFNDDSAGIGPNAYLVATVPQSNYYIVFIATAGAGETGAYTLAVDATTTAAASQPLFPAPRQPLVK
jgi:hypothetical protein